MFYFYIILDLVEENGKPSKRRIRRGRRRKKKRKGRRRKKKDKYLYLSVQ